MAAKSKEPYVLTRGYNSGVMAGFLVDRTSTTITLRDARQIFEWYGPETLTGLAQTGPGAGANKFDKPAPLVELNAADVCAIVHCTAEAAAKIAETQWTK